MKNPAQGPELLRRNIVRGPWLETTQNLIQTVYNYTEGPQYRELRRAFVSWTRHVLLPRVLPQVQMPPVDDLLEITDMLADQSRSWTHQWKMEGRQEGEASLKVRCQPAPSNC